MRGGGGGESPACVHQEGEGGGADGRDAHLWRWRPAAVPSCGDADGGAGDRRFRGDRESVSGGVASGAVGEFPGGGCEREDGVREHPRVPPCDGHGVRADPDALRAQGRRRRIHGRIHDPRRP